jgi:hypothetical protein
LKKTFFLLLLLAGCAADPAPLGSEQMAAVLFDIHLAEARSTLLLTDSTFAADTSYPVETRRQDSLAFYYRRVLASHKLTYAAFSTALDWYTAHPEALDSAYKQALRKAADSVVLAP